MNNTEQFKKAFTEGFSNYFDSNFSKVEKYIDYDLKVFSELNTSLLNCK